MSRDKGIFETLLASVVAGAALAAGAEAWQWLSPMRRRNEIDSELAEEMEGESDEL